MQHRSVRCVVCGVRRVTNASSVAFGMGYRAEHGCLVHLPGGVWIHVRERNGIGEVRIRGGIPLSK